MPSEHSAEKDSMTDGDWRAPSGHPTYSAPRRLPPPADMSTLDLLWAHEQIRDLAHRYALAVNMRDLDALVELFVDDVRGFGGRTGREALKEVFRTNISVEVDVLEVTTQVVNLLDADHATGTVYSRCEMGSRETWARQSIAYEDRYERRDGVWLFVDRKHLLFYGVEVPERPLDQPAAEWPTHVLGRGSLPYDWASWQAVRQT
jgi:ketosteroid isomerase-like protein